jgi:hypothetical protein
LPEPPSGRRFCTRSPILAHLAANRIVEPTGLDLGENPIDEVVSGEVCGAFDLPTAQTEEINLVKAPVTGSVL